MHPSPKTEETPPLRLSVIVPTFRRPDDLKRCLGALTAQERPADEVIVVVRGEDDGSLDAVRFHAEMLAGLRSVTVQQPGQVRALNAGLAAATGDVIAITDDDAVPHADWLARIVRHFASEPSLGGVGGRDRVHGRDGVIEARPGLVVGRVQWFGRTIGNHHLGTGDAREVDILKGANMSYRKKAIDGLTFDERLRGMGAQVSNDMAFSLALKRRGWRIVYDPTVVVEHFPSIRHDSDQRGNFNETATIDAIFNSTLCLLDHLTPLRRRAFFFWSVFFGSRDFPGMLQVPRLWLEGDRMAHRRFLAAQKGAREARQFWKGEGR